MSSENAFHIVCAIFGYGSTAYLWALNLRDHKIAPFFWGLACFAMASLNLFFGLT